MKAIEIKNENKQKFLQAAWQLYLQLNELTKVDDLVILISVGQILFWNDIFRLGIKF